MTNYAPLLPNPFDPGGPLGYVEPAPPLEPQSFEDVVQAVEQELAGFIERGERDHLAYLRDVERIRDIPYRG